ncbi:MULTISPECIES: hypothetical protein [Lysinibacillus]|uniref:Uncharacterized protein n=1 Tax=Lysinibacillus antri TaxID=2498145 RepID=A0A3S0QQ88_9BACI|nr:MULTISPECIES: hypothetical protein [Lysinibacillus]RUL53612.1 hypothetical protein EK386_08585 [Lysinibacillus antri]TSI06158.1 hypothetical protein FJQ64_10515 [Lysinibacillus sp. BW-2-10]
MLTFEQKQAVIESFPELTKKEISLKRLNYHFEDSLYEKTIVVEKLHPNGNGFVYVGDLLKYEKIANDKGLVNIRDFDEESLKTIIRDAIDYLSEEEAPIIETWVSREGTTIELVHDQRNWDIYYQNNLEETFGTKEAAVAYLREEGFRHKG